VGKKLSPMGIAVLLFAVILVVITSIRLTSLDSNFSNPIGAAIDRVLSPVERTIWEISTTVKDNFRAIFSFRKVKAENEELRKQVEILTGDNLKLKQQVLAALRYQELEKLFDSPNIDKFEKEPAVVINRNPSSWYHTVTVNKGSKHGIKVNDPVITNKGLVGKVVTVYQTSSDVLLILDGEGQVSAFLRDSKGKSIFGILSGSYKRGSRLEFTGHLKMDFKLEDEVNIGDLVVTSGYGGVYPKDIPIGIVKDIRLDASGLLKTATIEPLVDFDSLEEVYVIKMPEES